ncbi:nucleolar protein-like protein [Haloferax elongans ATCC BAA-1513]|uniref:Nucleolar protein-like protein n=1 Tax=Haloferax elongans ATCC BAA-1513 TaxID=1230453 RepID=M0HPP2_HALEO|nr:NOP5/NOP56 family protein [Haloferax elongans]ELZ85064.1 nucleolar protein-like protein [Haloferax elongans ATCC BAA-1513]
MTDAWFAGVDPDDPAAGATGVREGSADAPADWPAEAVQSGFVADESEYYERLREATIEAASDEVAEREGADDVQLTHAVRAMDDAERTANELAERVVEWAGTLYEDVPRGLDGVRDIADRDPTTPAEERVVSYATRAVDLLDERDELRAFIEERAPSAAPNLAEMAGPVLAARLISLAGGLDKLAKVPSGTVQVLGAEDALFAHLSGRASSPKHGVIFTHEYVNGTRPEDRGSAARAFAGKLSIAARIDHYSGDYRPEVHAELTDRIETIRARAEEGDE